MGVAGAAGCPSPPEPPLLSPIITPSCCCCCCCCCCRCCCCCCCCCVPWRFSMAGAATWQSFEPVHARLATHTSRDQYHPGMAKLRMQILCKFDQSLSLFFSLSLFLPPSSFFLYFFKFVCVCAAALLLLLLLFAGRGLISPFLCLFQCFVQFNFLHLPFLFMVNT